MGIVSPAQSTNIFSPVYAHWRQHNALYPPGDVLTHISKALLIRTHSDPRNFAESLRKIVGALDRDQTVTDVMTMEEALAGGLAPWRFAMRLFGIFSILAVSLAVVGIYGVMSYSVTRRAHEIAVRLALGAGRAQVVLLIVRRGLTLTLIGIAIGLAGSLGLTRFIKNLLYGIEPRDPASFVLVALLLAVVSLAACLIPALRAARAGPMATLRAE